MTDAEAHCAGTLVRVVCSGDRPFVAGLVLHPETQRAIVAAPILRHLLGQHADKLRAGFKRLGYRATIVRQAHQSALQAGHGASATNPLPRQGGAASDALSAGTGLIGPTSPLVGGLGDAA